jgi:hypothetical protein
MEMVFPAPSPITLGDVEPVSLTEDDDPGSRIFPTLVVHVPPNQQIRTFPAESPWFFIVIFPPLGGGIAKDPLPGTRVRDEIATEDVLTERVPCTLVGRPLSLTGAGVDALTLCAWPEPLMNPRTVAPQRTPEASLYSITAEMAGIANTATKSVDTIAASRRIR